MELVCKNISNIFYSVSRANSSSHHWEDALLDRVNNRSEYLTRQKRSYGAILDIDNIRSLEEKRDLFFPLILVLHNTKPVGHQVQILLIVWIELCWVLVVKWGLHGLLLTHYGSLFFPLLQDLVGLVISILLLGDFSLVLLTLLQLYSVSMMDVFLVLFILPLAILLPFPTGINALFSHGPRRSAGLARLYALWNITSLVNVVREPSIYS